MSAASVTRLVKCPQCRKPVAWNGNPSRPFCSERCRLIDLGCWADEDYRIAGPVAGALEDESHSDTEE